MKPGNESFNLHVASRTTFLLVIFIGSALQTALAHQSTPMEPASAPDVNSSEPPSDENQDGVDSRPQHVADDLAPSANLHINRQMLGKLSPLHFGQLSLVSASFIQSRQINPQSSIDSTILKSTVSYSIDRRGMDFAVEYSPTVWLSQNGPSFNLANHDFELSTQHKFGRWVFGATDTFYSLPLRSQFAQFGIDPNYSIRNTDPAFLAGDTLSNSAHFTADRLMGPADTIELGLAYLYYNVTNASNSQNSNSGLHNFIPDSSEHSAEGDLSWNHRLGWRSSLAVQYSFSQRYYTRESAIAESGISRYHSLMANYSYQPNSAWNLSFGFGPALWSGIAQRNSETYLADVSVIRKFRRSSVGVNVNRSDEFIGIIGDTLSNQANLVFDVALSRRWAINSGVGYSRQVLAPQATHAWRTWTESSYQIGKHYSWFVGCSFFRQTDTSLFNSLPFYFVSSGVRWQWNPRQQRRWGR